MHAVPPEGPLHHQDRDSDPGWHDEPATDSAVDQAGNRHRAALPTLLLVGAVILIVALVLLA